ncbi:hypothetical protein PCANC_20156 [Puccinia coronata f. sp. avenae]|uniref:Glycosyl transferase CAP10 domain-containing protein n=1 Tax=Puccinia coronata f. sp. avenae TaxID=200324 RepID=A0A2N5SUK3_9BASI|nr:hypothetical protein PCANC_20156 [Puccinia coronata f. sp. avenae]
MSPTVPANHHPVAWLSDQQERPLLPLRLNPLLGNYKGRSTLASRLVTICSLLALISTAVVLDRLLFRNVNEPHLLWDTNYHLTNAVVSRVCNIIPSSKDDSLTGLLASKLCHKQLSLKNSLQTVYQPDSGHEFGPAMDRMMDQKRCDGLFPNLYQELDRAVEYHSARGNITIQHLDCAQQYSHARVLIYRNRVYIKGFNGGPGLRTEAILNSIQEAVITSPELLPDVEFVLKTSDAPQGGDDEHPIWVLDRTKSQEQVWLMPDYGFYSWPEPKVGGMVEVRDKTAEREATLTWDKKISKAFWRGAILVKLREQLLEVSKGKPWSDIKPIVWQNLNGGLKTPEDHCNYKFLVHTEGYAYSGRLKYLQMCRSVVVGHEMQYIQHFHHLLDARPHSPTQNIAIAEGPGVEGLPKLMDALLADPVWAESIANNSYPLFRHYLSPAGVHCYWRQMFRSWAKVQAFVPQRSPKDTPFESFNLMHATDWAAH